MRKLAQFKVPKPAAGQPSAGAMPAPAPPPGAPPGPVPPAQGNPAEKKPGKEKPGSGKPAGPGQQLASAQMPMPKSGPILPDLEPGKYPLPDTGTSDVMLKMFGIKKKASDPGGPSEDIAEMAEQSPENEESLQSGEATGSPGTMGRNGGRESAIKSSIKKQKEKDLRKKAGMNPISFLNMSPSRILSNGRTMHLPDTAVSSYLKNKVLPKVRAFLTERAEKGMEKLVSYGDDLASIADDVAEEGIRRAEVGREMAEQITKRHNVNTWRFGAPLTKKSSDKNAIRSIMLRSFTQKVAGLSTMYGTLLDLHDHSPQEKFEKALGGATAAEAALKKISDPDNVSVVSSEPPVDFWSSFFGGVEKRPAFAMPRKMVKLMPSTARRSGADSAAIKASIAGKGKHIVHVSDSPGRVGALSHEFGHAKKFEKDWLSTSRMIPLPAIANLIGYQMARRGGVVARKLAPATVALGWLPWIAEEARASRLGMSDLRQLGSESKVNKAMSDKAIANAGTELGLAFGTYAGGAVDSALSVAAMAEMARLAEQSKGFKESFIARYGKKLPDLMDLKLIRKNPKKAIAAGLMAGLLSMGLPGGVL